MKYFGNGLSEIHKELNKIIRKKDRLEDAKTMFLELHAALHLSEISGGESNEVDLLFNDLSPDEYKIMSEKNETIAWIVWHIARIEDLTMNILVNSSEQIFNSKIQKRINSSVVDTGVSMSRDEIKKLSGEINAEELLNYRNTVGIKTREIIKNIKTEVLKQKVSPDGLNKIRTEGGVTDDSEWLLEYWGSKDIAGLLLMPPTRHLIYHLNDCCKLKTQIRKNPGL